MQRSEKKFPVKRDDAEKPERPRKTSEHYDSHKRDENTYRQNDYYEFDDNVLYNMITKGEPEQRGYYEKKVVNLHFQDLSKKENRHEKNRFYDKENYEKEEDKGPTDKNGHSTYHYYNRERYGKGGHRYHGARR